MEPIFEVIFFFSFGLISICDVTKITVDFFDYIDFADDFKIPLLRGAEVCFYAMLILQLESLSNRKTRQPTTLLLYKEPKP